MNLIFTMAVLGVFILIILIPLYVWSSLEFKKVLEIMNSSNPTLAWIPYIRYYALAEVCKDENGNINLLGKDLSYYFFGFYWVACLILTRIPGIGSILSLIIQILFLGTLFKIVYARIEQKDEIETQTIGFVSGFITLIALIKFTCYKK